MFVNMKECACHSIIIIVHKLAYYVFDSCAVTIELVSQTTIQQAQFHFFNSKPICYSTFLTHIYIILYIVVIYHAL